MIVEKAINSGAGTSSPSEFVFTLPRNKVETRRGNLFEIYTLESMSKSFPRIYQNLGTVSLGPLVETLPFTINILQYPGPQFFPNLANLFGNISLQIPLALRYGNLGTDFPVLVQSPSGQTLDILLRPELDAAFQEASLENWDGYGAKPANSASLEQTLKFLRFLSPTFPKPEVSIDPDGEISLDWFRDPTEVFSISFGEDGRLSFAGLLGKSKIRGVEYFGKEIPSIIIDYLGRFLPQEILETSPD